MKTINKIISLICVFMLAASCCANAAALRKDIKQSGSSLDRSKSNDILYLDFSGSDFPAGVTVGTGDGKIYLDTYEVMPKQKKNCLVINDTSYDTTYSGITARIATGTQTGLVGVEIRYMYDYDPEQPSTYGSFIMALNDSAGQMLSRHVIASSNGSSQFNYGGDSSKAMESTKIAANTWYTVKWIVDLDEKRMDFSFLNEGTGAVTNVYDAGYYTSGAGGNNLGRIDLQSSMYGGKYVFDYVRVSREKARMSDAADDADDGSADIGKGVESEKVAPPSNAAAVGRININLDGIYKFTTQDPYEKDGRIMATAKNLASFFNMGYVREGATCLINTPSGILMIKDGGAALGDKSVAVASEEKDGQIFISVEDLCAAVGGYDCSYDSDAKIMNITAAKAEKSEGGGGVEK